MSTWKIIYYSEDNISNKVFPELVLLIQLILIIKDELIIGNSCAVLGGKKTQLAPLGVPRTEFTLKLVLKSLHWTGQIPM